jgi:ATP-dependent DNA helicase RecG
MPKGRIPIKTYGVDTSYRQRIFNFILKNAAKGHQAYIVCPMVFETESETSKEKASAIAYCNALRDTYFKSVRVGLLHGKMKSAEKEAVMSEFKNGNIAVLVSTTVIEVGVDVPGATIIVIENAEYFGLSQLHQLRGRVGRGNEQSYCILVTDSKTDYTKARMEIMKKTINGFEIANEDLKLRGPGDFFGAKQHGLPELKIADISEDAEIAENTKKLAAEIFADDPDTNNFPELKKEVERLYGGVYGAF